MAASNMLSFLIGTVAGVVAGIVIKDKIMPSSKEGQRTSMVNILTEQNNTLKSKCAGAESRLTKMKRELETLKMKLRRFEDKGEDDDDAISDLKAANSKLLSDREALATELVQIKSLLTVKVQEIEELKDKLFELTGK